MSVQKLNINVILGGRWTDRTAEKITLDTFIRYSYGEKFINPTQLKVAFRTKVSDLLNLLPGGVELLLQDVFNLLPGEELSRKVWVAAKGVEFTIITQKVQDDRFTYNIYPSDLNKSYSHSKSDAKRIKKVFDWSTAVIAYPPNIKQAAVEFELEILRSKHTLKHDGYHLGLITDKRK